MRLQRRPNTIRGFSLIEVLVAVLVLALGLLGLGAVFPMVVRQQRVASETTLGLSARNGIQQIIVNNANFVPGGRGWPALRQYAVDEATTPGDWVPVEPDRATGDYIIPAAPQDPNQDNVVVPLSQRLYPLPFTTESDPRFVWDMAVRVVDPRVTDGGILVAIFIRPIDPAIRPATHTVNGEAEPYSLVATLLGIPGRNEPPLADRRYPVSVDKDGRPTLDGRRSRGAAYSRPSVVEMKSPHGPGYYPAEDWLSVYRGVSGDLLKDPRLAEDLLARQHQRFIDRAGNLYSVVAWKTIPSRGTDIQIVPGITGLTDANYDGKVDSTDLNPVVFVPQASNIEPLIFAVNP